MKTYPICDQDGQVFAFEIENVYISVKKLAMLLHSVHGVSDLQVRKLFSASPDKHIEFKYMGKEFMVWEPFGDNSRYWIGPKDETPKHIDVGAIETVIREHQPTLLLKVFGNIVSLKFLSPLMRWIKSKKNSV